ncbi:uncharacterized protein LOC119614686 [Lucilia sericata]|uniref:uncharacterized protein LOC119614686 n=1 Tax=Lucilia sericata TaxID=13632 RepID=UPI0018A8256F|nr:uncharacterized protein LOC119614686 [Lucilia sericata]
MRTDSTIVLALLQKPSFHWNTFVANRAASITETVNADLWSHVDSKDNPADIASRGCSASDLVNNELWWRGPYWLRLARLSWPSNRRRIEACLNTRPLCPVSDDPNELKALTPGHFLVGSPLLAPAEVDASARSLSIANRRQTLKILHQNFAIRWKEDYFKELHKRTKWQYPERNVSPNDLVVVGRDNLPPTQWLLGRIEKVMPGSDS